LLITEAYFNLSGCIASDTLQNILGCDKQVDGFAIGPSSLEKVGGPNDWGSFAYDIGDCEYISQVFGDGDFSMPPISLLLPSFLCEECGKGVAAHDVRELRAVPTIESLSEGVGRAKVSVGKRYIPTNSSLMPKEEKGMDTHKAKANTLRFDSRSSTTTTPDGYVPKGRRPYAKDDPRSPWF
jgi:hypothetical protein